MSTYVTNPLATVARVVGRAGCARMIAQDERRAIAAGRPTTVPGAEYRGVPGGAKGEDAARRLVDQLGALEGRAYACPGCAGFGRFGQAGICKPLP